MKRFIWPVVFPLWILVGCQGSVETPPLTATAEVRVSPPTETPVLIATPLVFPTLDPTATITLPRPTPSRTPSRTPVRSTSIPRPSLTAAPPGTLLDGNYAGTGNIRVQFVVSNGGTLASGGFFSFHCQVDGALSTYGFSGSVPVSSGKFEFGEAPDSSGTPRVSMACSATTTTQARCVIKNLLATPNCLNTPANASRK